MFLIINIIYNLICYFSLSGLPYFPLLLEWGDSFGAKFRLFQTFSLLFHRLYSQAKKK